MSPDTAIELGRLGGLGVLNLEVSGPVTRPDAPLREIRELDDKATARMQQMSGADQDRTGRPAHL